MMGGHKISQRKHPTTQTVWFAHCLRRNQKQRPTPKRKSL